MWGCWSFWNVCNANGCDGCRRDASVGKLASSLCCWWLNRAMLSGSQRSYQICRSLPTPTRSSADTTRRQRCYGAESRSGTTRSALVTGHHANDQRDDQKTPCNDRCTYRLKSQPELKTSRKQNLSPVACRIPL